MRLVVRAGHASSVLHPLIRLLDGPQDELRERALDTICSVALAIGPDFAIFLPTIKKVRRRHAQRECLGVGPGPTPHEAPQHHQSPA